MATKYFSQSLIYNTKKEEKEFIFSIFCRLTEKTLRLTPIWKGEKDLKNNMDKSNFFQYVKILASQIYTIRKAISAKSLLRGNNLISHQKTTETI